MADPVPDVKLPGPGLSTFTSDRIASLLSLLELMAAGDVEKRLPISPLQDELDALAHAINVLVGELGWSNARLVEAQEARAIELREAAARAERANAAMNVFLRNVSHELRTPIAAMVGFADLLASPDLRDCDRGDLVRRTQDNGRAVLSLLGNFLDLARLDAEKIVITPESVPVFHLVHEVLASLEITSRQKGLDVQVKTTGEALGTLRTDRYRLRQILVNVIGNAVKFTEAGGVLISLRVVHAAGGDQWLIDVADTGIGIAPERHPHLFEPFEQADASIAPTYGGAGLGLALSRRLAEQLDATLALLHSAPGAGTTFRLTLKALAGRPETDAGAAAAPGASVPAIDGVNGLSILLAEDHPDMRVAVKMQLEHLGASVEVACDGREAVAKAMSSTFDIILMDLRMPHMNGLEATRKLRKAGCAIPIVAITADPATFLRVEALDAGCDACLSKPFTLKDLIVAMNSSANAIPRRLRPPARGPEQKG